ncbi:hypothetical protein LguiB_012766 [Lonicera macranthoides]
MELRYHLKDREKPLGALPSNALMREIFGLSEPHVNYRLQMKIICWNCQGAGKQLSGSEIELSVSCSIELERCTISSHINLLWLVARDLNDVAISSRRVGGATNQFLKPFRFEAIWISHPDFEQLFRQSCLP